MQLQQITNSQGVAGAPTLHLVSHTALVQQEEAERERQRQAQSQHQVYDQLASYMRHLFLQAYHAKQPHQKVMLEAMLQRRGEYTAQEKQAIAESGQEEVFLKLTDVKCRAAESWIREIISNTADRPWTLKPTPIADLPPQVQTAMLREAVGLMSAEGYTAEEIEQLLKEAKDKLREEFQSEAELRAERMETTIADQLTEANFEQELQRFINDFITFQTAFMEGPILKRRKTLTWGPNYEPVVGEEITREVRTVSPLDVYPSPDSRSPQEGHMFIRERLSRRSLLSMKGLPGNKDDAIDRVLERFAEKGFVDWFDQYGSARAEAEGRQTSNYTDVQTIDALKFYGSLPGSKLLQWGMPAEKVADPLQEYECEAWLVDQEVIRCVLNPHPIGRRPLYAASCVMLPNSIWGQAIPQLMRDAQIMINVAARALAENMSIASGPQVAVDPDMLPEGESITGIYPWKVWQVNSYQSGSGKLPIEFWQASMHTDELLGIYDRFSRYADDITGIPAFAFGSDSGAGAAKTASGLSMLLGNTSKGIKQMVGNIGAHMIEPLIQHMYVHNMLFNDDESIKGDLKVNPGSTMALIQKEAKQLRQQEFLDRTANQIDMSIIGLEGRADILREVAKSHEIPESVVPDREVILQRLNAPQTPVADGQGLPA